MGGVAAYVLDPKTRQPILICGPYWTTRCGAAGEGASVVACAGHRVIVERDTPLGIRTDTVFVDLSQRTCPFAPPETAT